MFRDRVLTALLITVCSVAASRVVGLDRTCEPGYHMESDGVNCSPCPPNTYMSYKDHRNKTCQECDRVQPGDWKVVVQPCTWTTNTIIKCNRAHAFRFRGTCKPCTQCKEGEVEKRSCSKDRDRECQPSASMQTPTARVVDHYVIPKKHAVGSGSFFQQFYNYGIYIYSFIILVTVLVVIVIYKCCLRQKIYSIWKGLTRRMPWCCNQNPAEISDVDHEQNGMNLLESV